MTWSWENEARWELEGYSREQVMALESAKPTNPTRRSWRAAGACVACVMAAALLGTPMARAQIKPINPVPAAAPTPFNYLLAANGGELLVVPDMSWSRTIDGKEDFFGIDTDGPGVYTFKDEKPVTFDTFSTLVNGTSCYNLKDFELLVGNDSPTGKFQSIGKFTTQNSLLVRTPYQEFHFAKQTAKYLKINLSSSWGCTVSVAEFRLYLSKGR